MTSSATFPGFWEVEQISSLIRFDLQFFAGEKTEKATPKKRQEARKKGQVPKSQELVTAILLLGIFIILHVLRGQIGDQVGQYAADWFSQMGRKELTVGTVTAWYTQGVLVIGEILAPLFLAAILIGILFNFLQVGAFFQPDLIKPKFDKLNPISGFKRIFSTRAIAELAKSLLKLIIVFGIAYLTIRPTVKGLLLLWDMDIAQAVSFVETIVFTVAWRIGLALLVLAVFDYYYQRWEYERNLRMSKQEIKDEYKETEGDPQIKGKIRQRARQMAMQRMMQAVPEADVIITNPTHIAVALKYEAKEMDAPVVVAMGQGYLAEKIKSIAKEHRVAIVENKPLARALFSTAEIGEAIPAELYQSVAEVLAFVFRLRKRSV